MSTLDRSFYERDTKIVAIELLGKIICIQDVRACGVLRGMIVETEAYYGTNDAASHAACGITPRNRVMFGPGGRSYVYFNYGVHSLFNVVSEPQGIAGAVLIRAVEPLNNLTLLRRRRQLDPMKPNEWVSNGPGKWTQAFGITLDHNDLDLSSEPIWIEQGRDQSAIISCHATKRVGIRKAQSLPYRFVMDNNCFISKT